MDINGSSRFRRRAALLVATAALCSSQAFAQATAADKAAAEALFEEGLSLMKAGKFAEACAKLEQSAGVERGIGTSLYLAECYEKQGKTASAWGLFRDAASEAQARGESERAQQGRSRAARLEPRLSRLTLMVSERPAGLQVTRDGNVVPESLWNVAVPVDPGEHKITARAPGYAEYSQSVIVSGEAANLSATIPPLTRDASAPVESAGGVGASASTSSVLDEDPHKGNTQRTIGLVVGGAGVVALGVGAFFGVRAMNKDSDADAHCTGKVCSDRTGESLSDSAQNSATLANVFVIGGAALVAGGLTLYFTAPHGQERSVAVAGDGRGGARLVFGGSF